MGYYRVRYSTPTENLMQRSSTPSNRHSRTQEGKVAPLLYYYSIKDLFVIGWFECLTARLHRSGCRTKGIYITKFIYKSMNKVNNKNLVNIKIVSTLCACGYHFQQIGHQPGIAANPRRGQT